MRWISIARIRNRANPERDFNRPSFDRFQQIDRHLASQTPRDSEDRQSVTSDITEDVALSRDASFHYYRHYLLSTATVTHRPLSRQIWQWQSSSNRNERERDREEGDTERRERDRERWTWNSRCNEYMTNEELSLNFEHVSFKIYYILFLSCV